MDEQVAHLTSLGVSAVNISSCMEEDCDGVEAGEYSIVYGTPEAQWGISQDNKMAAFREAYSKLYELRSLAPNVPLQLLLSAWVLTKSIYNEKLYNRTKKNDT
ncbi:mediator of RNA polymerase II transcription subunit 34-like, partial [Paramuricea clavata]